MTVLLIAVAGAFGAAARYLTDGAVRTRWPSVFPWGTLAVNLAGSFLAGMVMAAVRGGDVAPGLATAITVGFCGALTTFSTFSFDTLRLVEQQAVVVAALNGLANIGGSVLFAAAGWALLN